MRQIKIVLTGEVPSWKSPIIDWRRAQKANRDARAFNPEYKKMKHYRAMVQEQLPEGFELLTGAIQLSITHYRPIPKYLIKEVEEGDPHCKKPDLTNLTKFSEDCVKGFVFEDDNQVALTIMNKEYSLFPRTEITISELR